MTMTTNSASAVDDKPPEATSNENNASLAASEPADSQHDNSSSLKEQEARVRQAYARHSAVYGLVVNSYAAVVIFVCHLMSMEMVFSAGLSVGLTLYVYYVQFNGNHDGDTSNIGYDGGILNWVLLSFAVITPLSAAVSMTFTRRERALTSMALIRATLLEVYTAHAMWDWGYTVPANNESTSGRQKSTMNWCEHADAVALEISSLLSDLSRWLTLPTISRARHRATIQGRSEADDISIVASKIYVNELLPRFARLSKFCETLKQHGLPPNEATRIRQWERIVLDHVEILRTIKSYRTPQALRTFGRLFSVLVPPVYAPFYAQVAVDVDSLALALVFAILTSVALTALFETVYQMEDPFVEQCVLDGIQVHEDLVSQFRPLLVTLRGEYFPDAPLPLAPGKDDHVSGC